MALHDSLRELVAVRGAGVVDEAEELRGALDDFLAEDEATLGELNLLVDAVRLGALRRLLDVMEHGAEPEAAIREAGGALARDRGTDDPTRSCWALATLGFALGKVDESLVRTFRGDAGTMPAPHPPTGPHGRAPQPAFPSPDDRPPTRVLSEQAPVASHPAPPPPTSQPTPPTSQPTPPSSQPAPPPPPLSVQPPAPTVEVGAPPPPQQYFGPVPPVIPEEKSSRAGSYVLVVLVALLLGGLVAAGFILLRSDGDDDPTAADDPTETEDGGTAGEVPRDRPVVSAEEMLVPYGDGESSVIYAVNPIDGSYRTPALTDGPEDTLPALSPDRRTMTYLVGPTPLTLMRFDPESAGSEPFFKDPGPCDNSGRPGWSPDGSRVALVCTGNDKDPDGIWLADADGTLEPEPIIAGPLVRGAPTWVSPTRLVYGYQESESETAPLTFWTVDVNDRVPEPLDVAVDGLQLTHIDWSAEAGKLLFLVSPPGEREIGDIWTMDADGGNAELLAEGDYGHPVWSADGNAIGVTIFMTLPSETSPTGEDELAYIPLDEAGNAEDPVIVADPPPGDVGVPVWGTR